MPTINAKITTSSPVLDLYSIEPFEITIDLFLDHSCPITFATSTSNLFNGKALFAGGLAFTDVSTGQHISRETIDVCGWINDAVLTQESESRFITLRPDHKHTITARIERVKSRLNTSPQPVFTTADEYRAWIESLPIVWKWDHSYNLEDGRSYEIDVDEDASIGKWWNGAKENLLKKSISCRDETAAIEDKIRIQADKRACFLVRRPDTDDSLDWP